MAHGYYERNDSGYTRGGLDVVTGINLFFKGILIFPILVLATYVGLALMKHMIFQGVPSMNQPTREQREEIRERDQQISEVPAGEIPQESIVSPYPMPGVAPTPPSLPGPSEYSRNTTISNCQYSPVCPPGGENRIGANGLPYVWPTATPIGGVSPDTRGWNTEIEEDPFN